MKTKLAVMVAAGLIGAAVGRADDNKAIVVDGSTTVGPIAKAFAEFYMNRNPGVNITVSESGSGNGAKSLMNASCDVGAMSRPMKASEIKGMEDSGRLAKAHIVAMDGLAIAVHPGNPLKAVTIQQIRDIYTGKIRNWKELGGPDQAIVVISRDTNSGTYECFETLVMNKAKMFEKTEYVGSNGAVRQRVMDTSAAIGYVGLAFTEGVKTVPVDGVEATMETVTSKKYPIARPLFFYTNGTPKKGTHLEAFVNLYKTAEGRKIVEDTGFVPAAL
jgi:phosphate transport system substrate-binding protein